MVFSLAVIAAVMLAFWVAIADIRYLWKCSKAPAANVKRSSRRGVKKRDGLVHQPGIENATRYIRDSRKVSVHQCYAALENRQVTQRIVGRPTPAPFGRHKPSTDLLPIC
jgi:hypothetical protein